MPGRFRTTHSYYSRSSSRLGRFKSALPHLKQALLTPLRWPRHGPPPLGIGRPIRHDHSPVARGSSAKQIQRVDLRGRPVGQPIAVKKGSFDVEVGAFAPMSLVLNGGE